MWVQVPLLTRQQGGGPDGYTERILCLNFLVPPENENFILPPPSKEEYVNSRKDKHPYVKGRWLL